MKKEVHSFSNYTNLDNMKSTLQNYDIEIFADYFNYNTNIEFGRIIYSISTPSVTNIHNDSVINNNYNKAINLFNSNFRSKKNEDKIGILRKTFKKDGECKLVYGSASTNNLTGLSIKDHSNVEIYLNNKLIDTTREIQKELTFEFKKDDILEIKEQIGVINLYSMEIEYKGDLFYFNNAGSKPENQASNPSSYKKEDYPDLTDFEFIKLAQQVLMDKPESHKAFVAVYTNNNKENISHVNFKSSIDLLMSAPNTTTGNEVYLLDDNKEKASTIIGSEPIMLINSLEQVSIVETNVSGPYNYVLLQNNTTSTLDLRGLELEDLKFSRLLMGPNDYWFGKQGVVKSFSKILNKNGDTVTLKLEDESKSITFLGNNEFGERFDAEGNRLGYVAIFNSPMIMAIFASLGKTELSLNELMILAPLPPAELATLFNTLDYNKDQKLSMSEATYLLDGIMSVGLNEVVPETKYKDVDGNVIFSTPNTTLPDITNVENKEKIVSVEFSPNVTSIGDRAFEDCSGLQSIDMPYTVTTIGDYAFQRCINLTHVGLNGVTTIGDYAFQSCSSLITITALGLTLTSIGTGIFYQCTSLEQIQIPGSITTITTWMFNNCIKLNSIAISDSIINIEHEAFDKCSSLKSISIPSSVTSINETAFRLSGLKTVYIKPESKLIQKGVISYGTVDSFYGSSAGSVTIMDPNNIPTLYKDVDGNIIFSAIGKTLPDITNVENKEKIVSVDFSPNVTSIGYRAFYQCSALQSVTIGDSVTSIGSNAFYQCSALQSVTIPDSVTTIERGAFSFCSSLESIIIPDSVTSFKNAVFEKSINLKTVKLSNSITSIPDHTFYECNSLESITIPNSVTSIGNNAFMYCKALQSITIPDNVTNIGKRAFYACRELQSMTIGNSVISISDEAFEYCNKLQSVTIPDSVTTIGTNAFEYCSSLKTVNIKSTAKLIKDGTISYGTVDSFYGSTGGSVTIRDPDNIPEGPAYLTTLPENLKSMIHYTHDDPNFITISVADDFTAKQAFTEFQKYGFDELDESLLDFDWRNITNTTDIDNKLSFSKYNIKELMNKLHIDTGDPENSYALYTVPFKKGTYYFSVINQVLSDPNDIDDSMFSDGEIRVTRVPNSSDIIGKSIDYLNNTFQNNIIIQQPIHDQNSLWKTTEKLDEFGNLNPYLHTRIEVENSDWYKQYNIAETTKGYNLLTLQYKDSIKLPDGSYLWDGTSGYDNRNITVENGIFKFKDGETDWEYKYENGRYISIKGETESDIGKYVIDIESDNTNTYKIREYHITDLGEWDLSTFISKVDPKAIRRKKIIIR